MRWSKTLIPTLKEDPADAEVISHKLLVRAGFIRQVSRGIYDYFPLALKVIRKIETIVRQEMDRAGAQELLAADRFARRALARERPLGDLRQGTAALQRPPRARFLSRSDP